MPIYYTQRTFRQLGCHHLKCIQTRGRQLVVETCVEYEEKEKIMDRTILINMNHFEYIWNMMKQNSCSTPHYIKQ